jgi:hypothetical protein
MQFVLMFGVILILPILCLFVLLRLAARLRESEDPPGTWNLESQQVVSQVVGEWSL